MYRLKFYLKINREVGRYCTYTETKMHSCVSQKFKDKDDVEKLLEEISKLDCYSGSAIEIYVDGIGWVVDE